MVAAAATSQLLMDQNGRFTRHWVSSVFCATGIPSQPLCRGRSYGHREEVQYGSAP